MSFFDDDDPPTRAQPRARPASPRRPAPAGGAARPRPAGGSGGGTDPELARRRLIAAGIGVVFIFILFFGIKGCLGSRADRALKDYNREVTQIATDSAANTKSFFEALNTGGTPQDLQGGINTLRVTSDQLAKQARNLDVPGDMQRVQNNLELVLNLRTTALQQIAALVTGAKSDNAQTAEQAVSNIAGQMQQFLASDVIYSQRVAPGIKAALNDAGVTGQQIVRSQSLPDIGWLQVASVAGVLDAKRAGGGQGADSDPAPGLHGHGLTSVAIGTTTLQPDPTSNRVPATGNVAFTVKFQNSGDNDEQDVNVTVTIRPGGGTPIKVQRRVDVTRAKQEAEVTIPLGQAPPIGQPSRVIVTIAKVPGEKNVDNNTGTFLVTFER